MADDPKALPQFEDRVLYYLVELVGDRPLPLGSGIHEGDLLGYFVDELGVSANFARDLQFHASEARGILLASIDELEKEGLVEARKVMGPWTIRPTRSGRLRVKQWREKWKKEQQAQSIPSKTQAPPPEAQEAWIEVARLRRELQLAQRGSSQAHAIAESTLPIQLFFSYAYEDQELRDELEKHLASLKKQRLIVGWHDRDINAGKEWQHEIDRNIQASQIILLLVSPDFMNSDYCYGTEMMRAMARHEANEAIVIPIILRPVDWEGAPFSKLQALPAEGKPITSWPNRDEAFLDIAKRLRKVVTEMLARGRVPQVVDRAPQEARSMILPENTSPDFKILTSPTFQENQPHWIDVNAIEQAITIKNIGKENAYDICAVLFGCETYIVPQTIPQERMNGTDSIHWREVSHCPTEPGETLSLTLRRHRDILDGTKKIGSYTLYAPHEPGLGAMMHSLDTPFASARLTLTYRDFSQRRYTQTFDYYHYKNGWAYLSHPERVSVDLRDILA